MDHFTDPSYLRDEQYKDATNLTQRVALHERFSTNPTGWLSWVFAQLELPQSARLLEVGCGPGLLWGGNVQHIEGSWRITLSDFSEGMVGEARSRLAEVEGFRYACLDVQAIPFVSQTFDIVIANHMLYHVPDLDEALEEITRVLNPDGVLYASTNGESHLREMANLVRVAGGNSISRDEHGLHRGLAKFSLQSGGRKLERYFGQIEILRYPDSLRVTDPDAIVRFVASSSAFRLSPDGLRKLGRQLETEISRNGAIEITKDPGMFVARTPKKGD